MEVKDFKIGVIYKYMSPSGKIYIGQTVNEKSRKSQHKTKNVLTDTYFGAAIRKYGFENFTYEILIKFKPTINKEKLKRILDKLEQRYIKLYKSDIREFGYNLNKGGEGNIGYKHTSEMIEHLKSLPKSNIQLKNLECGRGSISEETKEKMSLAKTKNKKQVGKYDLEDNLLETFKSIQDAAKSLEEGVQKTKANKIGECCNEQRKTIYGYIWKFII